MLMSTKLVFKLHSKYLYALLDNSRIDQLKFFDYSWPMAVIRIGFKSWVQYLPD